MRYICGKCGHKFFRVSDLTKDARCPKCKEEHKTLKFQIGIKSKIIEVAKKFDK